MQPRVLLILLMLIVIGGIGVAVGMALGTTSSEPVQKRAITFDDALSIATHAIEGQVISAELTTEGARPVYEFQILATGDVPWNVGVDGGSGTVTAKEKQVPSIDPAFAAGAEVSVEEARGIALSSVPGNIDHFSTVVNDKDEAFYVFDVHANAKGEFRVVVNARTGEVRNASPQSWEVGKREPIFLFAQHAESGSLDPAPSGNADEFTLTLQNVGMWVTYFSDRPNRISGFMPTSAFVSLDSLFLPDNPPNASVLLTDEDGEDEELIVVELRHPRYEPEARRLDYVAKVRNRSPDGRGDTSKGEALAGKFSEVSLFIDATSDLPWEYCTLKPIPPSCP